MAFVQRRFGLFSLGDIEIDTRYTDRPAGIVEEHSPLSKQPVYAPVWPDNAEFGVPDMRLFETLPHKRLQPIPVIRMNQAYPLLRRQRRMVRRQTVKPGKFP